MTTTDFPRPLGVPQPVNPSGYDGTSDALDAQLKHGQALMDVVRAARRYIHGIGDPGRNLLHLAHTVAALDALEGK